MKPRPPLVPHFIGRNDILESLYGTHFSERSPELHEPTITVLRGLGGSGKTQIGLRFALEFETRFPGVPVYFLDARSETNLQADYQTLIRSQGSSHRSSSYKDALVWLATGQQNWLAILDNADDPTLELFQYIPNSLHGHIIITTRNDTYQALAPNSSYHIEGLTTPDAIHLLLNLSRYSENDSNPSSAEKIVEAVGCLPLAVTHAGAYIGMHRCISTYLNTYNKSKAELMLSKPNILRQDYQMSVATTIQISIDRLSTEAKDAMRVFARLNATSIAHDIIQTSAQGHFLQIDCRPEEEALSEQTAEQADALVAIFCPSGEWDEFNFNKLIEECLQYSLLRVTTQEDARFYSMHILVQSYLKTSSNPVRNYRTTQLAIRLLGSAITIDDNYTYLAYNRLLVPHVRLIEVAEVIEAGDHECFAHVLEEQGSSLLASRHLECCISKRQEVLGDNHHKTVLAMGNLALLYSYMGRYRDAMEFQEKVLEMRKQISGDGHTETVRAMNNLALSYRNLGRHQDALELREAVLEMWKELLGDDHPDTMRAMGNLAASYSEVGQLQDAMELREKVLEMRKRLLGHGHVATVMAMHNLAASYHNLGRHQEALELEERVLEMLRQMLGDDHPNTLMAMGNLAASYRKLGMYRDARELEEKVLQMRRQISGEEHPYTLLTMWNLSFNLDSLGMQEQRLVLLREALPLYEKVYGKEHSDTIQIQEWIISYAIPHSNSSTE